MNFRRCFWPYRVLRPAKVRGNKQVDVARGHQISKFCIWEWSLLVELGLEHQLFVRFELLTELLTLTAVLCNKTGDTG